MWNLTQKNIFRRKMFVFFHVRNKKNHLVSRTFFSPLIKYFSTQFHTRTQNLLKKCSHWVSQIKICVSPDFFFFPQVFTAIKRTYQLIQEKTFFHQFSSHKHKSVNASVLFSLFSEMTKKILRGKKNYFYLKSLLAAQGFCLVSFEYL